MSQDKTSRADNPSSGVDAAAGNDLTVGRDVVGRDSVTHTTTTIVGLDRPIACGLMSLIGVSLIGLLCLLAATLLNSKPSSQDTASTAFTQLPGWVGTKDTPTQSLPLSASSPPVTETKLPEQPSPLIIDMTGYWRGLISQSIGDSVYNFNYVLELSQVDVLVTGSSKVEEVHDPKAFNSFTVSGQVVQESGGIWLQISETEYQEYQLSSVSDAASLKNLRLQYYQAEGVEYLKGNWTDRRRLFNSPSGPVQLVRQP